MNYGIDKNPNKDTAEITVTLTNGAVQVFIVREDGKVNIKDSTYCYSADQFSVALDKMRAAGATITEKTL